MAAADCSGALCHFAADIEVTSLHVGFAGSGVGRVGLGLLSICMPESLAYRLATLSLEVVVTTLNGRCFRYFEK